jgi:uncharacterized membrane protein YtjA (UPF0391 family)
MINPKMSGIRFIPSGLAHHASHCKPYTKKSSILVDTHVLVIVVIAALLSLTAMASAAAGIAKIMFIFMVLLVILLVSNVISGKSPQAST